MISSVRHQILEVLAEISALEPELRFGQLVATMTFLARETEEAGIWEVEDDELLAAARRHLALRRETRGAPVSIDLPESAPEPESLQK
jgi:hypothetical protein